jgi:hypothetical protein
MRVCSTGIVTSASKMEASCRAVCLNRISMFRLNERDLATVTFTRANPLKALQEATTRIPHGKT